MTAVLVIAAAVSTAACDSSVETSAPGASNTSSASSQLGVRLRPLITQAMHELAVPGAVVLVRTPAGKYEEAFGTRQIGKKDPIKTGDHFRIGSISKTMLGTIVLQLVQEGRIALSNPISKYRFDVPNGDHITLEQLLNMRSGLYNYTELESFNRTVDTDPTKVWHPEEMLTLALAQPSYFPPGQGFHYSNTNAVLLGLIVEQVTGQKLDDVLRERIFAPLGLHNTLMPPITSSAIPQPHPHGYMFGTNVSTLTDPALPPTQQAAARDGTLRANDLTDVNPSEAWAAGTVTSTADDLAGYVKPLVTGGLLDPGLQQRRLTSFIPVDPTNPDAGSYGLALTKAGSMIGHDGLINGYGSFMGYDPASGDTVIVLTNLAVAPDGTPTADDIAAHIISNL